MKKLIILISCTVFVALVSTYAILPYLNSYQRDGEISLRYLDDKVTVHRDASGIPYVFANNMPDAIRSQGFVVAQDRIFQVEMYRAIIDGRLASIIGESGLNSDIKMLVIGIRDNAERHLSYLDEESKNYLEWYAQGYNAFVSDREKEFPIELGLLGITPKKMEIVDLLAVQHFAGFIQSRNYEDEILSLNIANEIGFEKAKELLPLNINPDRESPIQLRHNSNDRLTDEAQLNEVSNTLAVNPRVALPASGSNNWVSGNTKSANGMPILVNDPHLDASILPGPWYPIGIFTPSVNAVGANLPGVPGLLLGRTQHLSFGVTNAYGDSQDLYIEKIDPQNEQRYMDGNVSKPIRIERKTIEIKDKSVDGGKRQKIITIRHTKRGPIISDHESFAIKSNQVVAFRAAAADAKGRSLGFIDALTSKTVADADRAFSKIDVLYFNYVFADKLGGIGHRSTGVIPLRDSGETPKVATRIDDWRGTIPKHKMPGQINPAKDWLGTSNHDVIPDNYPYYYSTHFSPNYRYLRTKEILSDDKKRSSDEHWSMLKDVKNKHAERIAPIFLAAMENQETLSGMHRELSTWDFQDKTDSVGATLFHLMHEYLVRLIFEDEMSSDLFKTFLQSRYYWLQRSDALIASGESQWFDIQTTDKKETLNDLIVLAALKSKSTLQERLGEDQSKWRWGRYHKISFFSPLRQQGLLADLLGGGTHEVSGSGETLNRGQYSLNEGPYRSQWFSSLRMVADMSDNKKIMGSISGGNASRQFHPYFKSQLSGWLKQEWIPWWFDKASVVNNSKHKVELIPTQ